MASVSMVSTAATFCCLACGISLGASGSSDLFLFLSVTADAFQGAGGSSVPYAVWKEKQSKVRCPILPHRQHPSLIFLCASISFWGTPCRADPVDSHPFFFGALESFFLGSRLVVGHLSSFFRSSLRFSSVRVALPVGFPCSLACFRALFFSTCSAAW